MSPKMVYVVDDDRQILQLLGEALKKSGYNTIAASDGKRALDLVKDKKPDMIIMDMAMPQAGGYEVLKALQCADNRDIPILLISGAEKDASLQQILTNESNVRGFLAKPLKVTDVLDKVNEILKEP